MFCWCEWGISYSKVQEVCGQFELHVYDVCEVCLRLFPLDDENSFRCSTTGCVGYVEKSIFMATE